MSDPVILIDAYSQIFRSFYAIRQLNNSRGEPTNAIFVFTRLLLSLQRDYPTKTGAMLFDCGKVDFRMELAPDYKANRAEMPDELKVQIPVIREMAEAFGWPLLQETNYEADDLIAAFARAVAPGSRVRIVSSDKDLTQLVNSEVTMLSPAPKGGFEERGFKEVQEKYAVTPEQMVDYLALIGDSSDNIPGVPGVGPKTAAQILEKYGVFTDWENDLSRIENPKLREKLEANLDVIRRNRKLVALLDKLPERLSPPENQLRKNEPDWAKVREICERMELRSILKELPEAGPAAEEPDLFSQPEEKSDSGEDMVQGELF